MESKTVERLVTEEIFITLDGKEFNSKAAAVEHEKMIELRTKAQEFERKLKEIPRIESNAYIILNIDDVVESFWIKPRSQEDIELIHCRHNYLKEHPKLVLPIDRWTLVVCREWESHGCGRWSNMDYLLYSPEECEAALDAVVVEVENIKMNELKNVKS